VKALSVRATLGGTEKIDRVETLASLSLLSLIPELTDHHRSPYHLRYWCELIERANTEPVRAMCSIPIRHFKTETTVHGIIWLLLRHPNWRIIFMTHSAEAATKWGKRIRQLAEGTPVGPTRNWSTIAEWRNEAGGGVVVMSADQSKIGYDVDALIVDDPLDELHCEDPNVRESVDEAISMYTARCMKAGKRGPVLIVASRFHPDDPIGRRLLRTAVNWEYVHNAAITTNDKGEEQAFAPDVWPLDELKKTRAELAERDPGERVWFAQFQNDPKPIGAELFGPPTHYDTIPSWAHRIGYGVDLAFTAGATSDYFAVVAVKLIGRDAYILDVHRTKLDAHMIESTLKTFLARHGRGPMYSYVSGPEVGMVQLMIERGIPFVPMKARFNKLVRSERTKARWNEGRIRVPRSAPWLNGFLHRVDCFRGNEHDEGDDEVDALASVSDGMMGGASAATVKSLGIKDRGRYAGFLG
jgi:predicted phage terminase large subunit-like protein